MKILLTGADSPYAIERFYSRHLINLGLNLKCFYAQNTFLDYYHNKLFNKLLFRLGFSSIINDINDNLKSEINIFNPDVLFVFKGMEVTPDVLKWTKSKGIYLVNYNPDNPFVFSGRGSGNANITQSIYLYDLHFTYNRSVQRQLLTTNHTKVVYLPFAYEHDASRFDICQQEKEVLNTCFVGNPDKDRISFIKKLADMGVALHVYGHGWHKAVKHRNIVTYEAIYGLDLWKTLRKYRVQLNMMRVHNLQSHNMRTFEIPGIGGIQLAPDTPEHQEFFTPDKEIFLYNSVQDAASQINKILQFSETQANLIRQQAHKAVISGKHTYAERAMEVKIALEELIK